MNEMSRIINNQKRKSVRKILRAKQTPQETIIWSKIRNKKTGYKWRRQVSIGRYIADFYCREKFLVIEIDGSQHKNSKNYDKEREVYFSSLEIKTLRFWNSEIDSRINEVMEKINTELKNQKPSSPLLSRRGARGEVHLI